MENNNLQPTLFGIGLGPGDPGLITLKAMQLLLQTDVIAYPVTRAGASGYAEAILDRSEILLQRETPVMMLPLVFPMTRDQAVLQESWKIALEEISAKLNQGLSVAFITEGDPLFYSTFIHLQEEIKRSRPETSIESVSGVTSFCASASALSLSIADSDQKIAIVPATDDLQELRRVIESFDTIVLMKVAKVLTPVIGLLEELGLAQNAAIVSRAGNPDESIYRDVAALKNEKINYLSTMIIKKDNSNA